MYTYLHIIYIRLFSLGYIILYYRGVRIPTAIVWYTDLLEWFIGCCTIIMFTSLLPTDSFCVPIRSGKKSDETEGWTLWVSSSYIECPEIGGHVIHFSIYPVSYIYTLRKDYIRPKYKYNIISEVSTYTKNNKLIKMQIYVINNTRVEFT